MYTASSIVEALKKNKNLSITGLEMVACPIKSCIVAPEKCGKGQKQTCKKQVNIIYEHDGHNKMVELIFYYHHKEITREGFIKKSDFALGILLSRGIIKL